MNRTAVIVVLVVVALVVGLSSIIFVNESEFVLVTQFGKPKRTYSSAGLQFKMPFAETAIRIDKRILSSDANAEVYLTADKKRLVADPITRWRVIDALKFYSTVQNQDRATLTLDDIVVGELRQELAKHTMSAMVGSARGDMMTEVTRRAATKAQEFGIEVVDVRIKHLDLPPQVQESVFNRMIAERKRLAKAYRAQGQEESDKITSQTDLEQETILAEARKTAEEVQGEGDAAATRIYAEAYNQDPEFFAFVRNLEAYEKSINENATIVLSTDSDLFKYMTRPGTGPE